MAKQTFTTGQVLTAAQMNSLQSNDFNQTVSVKTASYTLVAADKGTRIEFNTSGSVTCTVNTGLFDAGDTLIIQNRGAGAVTVTAGTATVNTSATLVLSQYDAGTLYFVSASAAIFFNSDAGGGSPLTTKGDLFTFGTADARLPIGTNNHVLTADSAETLGMKWAAAPAAAFKGCSLYGDGDFNANSGVQTVVAWTQERFDTDSFHSTTTNNSRITIPSGLAGKYLVQGKVAWNTTNTTGRRGVTIYKNGSGTHNVAYAGTQYTGGDLSVVMDLAVSDYIQMYVYQDSGDNNVQPNNAIDNAWFIASYLGA